MGDVHYPNDEAILAHVCGALETMHHPEPPPTRDQIARMLSVAFAASLESEEGRPVTFSVFFTRGDYPNNYKFRERTTFSPGALVRLSAALDKSRSRIAVAPNGDDLEIKGVWHAGSKQLGLFVVHVFSPGVLLVKYQGNLILTYRRGQFVRYDGTHNPENEAENLIREPGPGYSDGGRNEHSVVCRLRAIEEMMRIGHGGTLLIVPPASDWRSQVASEGFAPAAAETRLRDTEEQAYLMWVRRGRAFSALTADDAAVARLGQEARREHAVRLLGGHEIRQELAAELDALARFTATDGMVLIQPDLALLGFGVFFELGEPPCAIRSVDPYEAEPREIAQLSRLGGARHQSAAIAAARLPGALAMVVSTDGSLTAMRRATEAEPLSVHRHLEMRLPKWPAYQ